MFDVLLESRAARQRRTGSAALSTVVHGSGIALAILVTLARPAIPVAGVRPRADTLVFVSPSHRNAGATDTRTVSIAPRPLALRRLFIDAPDIPPLPPIDAGAPTLDDPGDFRSDGGSLTRGMLDGDAGGSSFDGGGVIGEHRVDRAPRLIGPVQEPRYPATLRSAGIEGRVVAELVVDTLGRAELDDVRFIAASHPLFAQAVRDMLPRYRFTPGELAGRKVRTRVQIPFDFTLTR